MPKSLSHRLLTLAVPLVMAGAGLTWMLGWPGKGGDPISYETGEVSRGTIRKIVATSGPVRALVTVQVGSQLSGQIKELKADFNTEVKAGDVMAVLDNKTYVSKVASAKADLAMAQAQLVNQEAALQKGTAVLRQAERATTRQQTLASKGITSSLALDTAVRDTDVAKAEFAVTQAQIVNAKAQIAQRQALLEQAQIDLDRAIIRSPIDGTVISRTVDVGQTVAASLQAPELFKIAQDLHRIRIEAQVNEADVGAVAEGNAVTFTVDAYPDRQFEGRIIQVRLAATELNNVVTYPVIIEAQNPDRKLFPGMTANAQVESARKDGVLRIPADALRFKPRDGTIAVLSEADQRREQLLDRLVADIALTAEQRRKVSDELKAMAEETKAKSGGAPAAPSFGAPPQSRRSTSGGSAAGGADGRGRYMERIERVVASVITDAQKPAFDKWKAGREQRTGGGRSAARAATVYVMSAGGTLESRSIRVGLTDDQYAEVIGPGLKEGDKIVVRTKMTVRK